MSAPLPLWPRSEPDGFDLQRCCRMLWRWMWQAEVQRRAWLIRRKREEAAKCVAKKLSSSQGKPSGLR